MDHKKVVENRFCYFFLLFFFYSHIDFSFMFSLIYDIFLWIYWKLQVEIYSFLTGMAFIHSFVWRNDISTTLGKKWWLRTSVHILSLGQRKYHFFTQKNVEMPSYRIFLQTMITLKVSLHIQSPKILLLPLKCEIIFGTLQKR